MESTLEGANGNGNSKRPQQDLTDLEVKAHEEINARRESITSSARTRVALIKNDPRKMMVTRNQARKASAREIVSALFEPDPRMYSQAIESVKPVEWKVAVDAELASLEQAEHGSLYQEPKRLHTK